METRQAVGPLLLLLMFVLIAYIPLAAQDPAVGINFTTWQQDDPQMCPQGCVYRTGQNLKESWMPHPWHFHGWAAMPMESRDFADMKLRFSGLIE